MKVLGSVMIFLSENMFAAKSFIGKNYVLYIAKVSNFCALLSLLLISKTYL